jgi:hypothetical protein
VICIEHDSFSNASIHERKKVLVVRAGGIAKGKPKSRQYGTTGNNKKRQKKSGV